MDFIILSTPKLDMHLFLRLGDINKKKIDPQVVLNFREEYLWTRDKTTVMMLEERLEESPLRLSRGDVICHKHGADVREELMYEWRLERLLKSLPTTTTLNYMRRMSLGSGGNSLVKSTDTELIQFQTCSTESRRG